MKLASIFHDNAEKIAAVNGDGTLIDLARAAAAAGLGAVPNDMISLIELGPAELEKVRKAVTFAASHPNEVPRIAADTVQWRPPVRHPSKICCLALNNSANADRIMSGPKHPAIFIKGANALVGHQGNIELKPKFGRCHPEPELAVVIGKFAKEIAPSAAYDHVFGYTVHNDITSPIMRGEDTFHYRAIHPSKSGGNEIEYVDSYTTYPGRYKGSDTFSPLGPWLVTRDEIENPHDLTVTCSHKGEVVTQDNTQNLFHKIPDVLAFITEYITLLPGDIVSMGTALKRTGAGGKAVQNVDLTRLGGPISVTIEKIGTLSNGVALK